MRICMLHEETGSSIAQQMVTTVQTLQQAGHAVWKNDIITISHLHYIALLENYIACFFVTWTFSM